MVRSLFLLSALSAVPALAAGPVSYFPDQHLGQFLVERFDLASIRSSLGPRRSPDQRTFAALGLKPTTVRDDLVEFDLKDDWFYQLRISRPRDINGDGIADVAVCFTDQAQNGGSYLSAQTFLVTRYSADGPAVALHYEVDSCVDK